MRGCPGARELLVGSEALARAGTERTVAVRRAFGPHFGVLLWATATRKASACSKREAAGKANKEVEDPARATDEDTEWEAEARDRGRLELCLGACWKFAKSVFHGISGVVLAGIR